MVAYARFVMRDNGLAIHINPQHVTQVRATIEGDPAIYVAGRDTAMLVEGTLEAVIRKLEAAAAGLRLADSYEPAPEPPPPPPPVREMAPEPAPEPVAAPKPKPKATAKPAKSAKVAKPKAVKAEPTVEPEAEPAEEPVYSTESWFRGSR